jgi:Tol biopolymer transport system component
VTQSPGDDIQPDWSAAHGLIAFTSGRLWGTTSPAPGGPLSSQELSHLPLDIWITNEDGSFTAAVTTDGLFNAGPNWSPDGQRIAFHSYRNGNWDIFIADDLPIIVPVEPATWGRVKAGFRGN